MAANFGSLDVKNLFLPGHKKFTYLPWRTPPPQYPLTPWTSHLCSRMPPNKINLVVVGERLWVCLLGHWVIRYDCVQQVGQAIEASCFYKKQTLCLLCLEIWQKLFSALGRDWEKKSIRNYFFRQISMTQEDFRQEKFVKKQSPRNDKFSCTVFGT